MSVIGTESTLLAPDRAQYEIGQKGAKLTLEYRGRRYVLPAETRSALHAMGRRPVFQPKDLPGPLDLKAKLTLV